LSLQAQIDRFGVSDAKPSGLAIAHFGLIEPKSNMTGSTSAVLTGLEGSSAVGLIESFLKGFHQFVLAFHLYKEKEMVNLRKWFPALAVAAAAISLSSTASAQVNNPPLQCSVTSVPPVIRGEGFAELAGDVVITCTGGQPTFAGANVPQVNVTVSANTNITSRIYNETTSNPANANIQSSEALLMVDQPTPEEQRACLARTVVTGGNAGCGRPFTGVYAGATAAAGANGLNYKTGANSVNGITNNLIPNVWQGRRVTSSSNDTSILWSNVPIDPPGTNANRIIRLTNIRVDATQIGLGLVPTPVQLTIQINPPNGVPLDNASTQVVTVAFVSRGLTVNLGNASTFRQCVREPGAFNVTFREGFVSAFRNRFIATTGIDNPAGPARPEQYQRFPGQNTFTESGFFRFDMPLIPTGSGDLFAGSRAIGYASQGTRLAVRVPALPAGVEFVVPNDIRDNKGNTDPIDDFYVRLVADTNSAGSGGTFTTPGGTTTVTSGLVVYEVIAHDPFNFENLVVPMTIRYNGTPALGSSSVQAGFAPFYAAGGPARLPSATLPEPRFRDDVVSGQAFQIVACRTHILFPFVSNQLLFDTGLAISNTSLDTGVFDTTPQEGTCRLHFYGNTAGGGAAPAFITSQVVRPGTQLLYTLSGGGNLGLTGVPGFQGYVIAVCEFQYGHGFAYITDNFGGTPRTAEGYLALILDEDMMQVGDRRNNRWSYSEILGH
jgi:hypothetical protein